MAQNDATPITKAKNRLAASCQSAILSLRHSFNAFTVSLSAASVFAQSSAPFLVLATLLRFARHGGGMGSVVSYCYHPCFRKSLHHAQVHPTP